MQLQHIIIDDFFDQPDDIRRRALASDFPARHEKEVYPGRNSSSEIPLPGIERLVSSLVNERVVPAQNSSHQRPRLALEGDLGQGMSVHMDMCHWSGIIYLTPDAHCQGGTHFFRHKKTGWEMAPVWPGMAETAGFATPDEALKSVMADSTQPDAWEETMKLPMKYNRLVLFRGYLWHDAGRSFGTTPETGRLIMPLFFETVM
ncbi:MAG: DUF6445 family protein [Pseudomonadota bacterium]|mgnify:CR=1 FL=1